MPDISETIEQVAAEPRAHSKDGESTENPPLPELIEADKYLIGKTAAAGTNSNGGPVSGWGMTRPARGVPPGTA